MWVWFLANLNYVGMVSRKTRHFGTFIESKNKNINYTACILLSTIINLHNTKLYDKKKKPLMLLNHGRSQPFLEYISSGKNFKLTFSFTTTVTSISI